MELFTELVPLRDFWNCERINQMNHYCNNLPQASINFANIHYVIINLIYIFTDHTGHSDIGQVILDQILEVTNVHINALVRDNKFYGAFNAVFAVFH